MQKTAIGQIQSVIDETLTSGGDITMTTSAPRHDLVTPIGYKPRMTVSDGSSLS